MNTKLCKSLIIIALVFINLIGFSACTKEYITEDHSTIIRSEIITRDYEIFKDHWNWNSIYNRYECTIDAKEINKDLYEYGTVIGTVFVLEKDSNGGTYEVQKNMPFVQTYKDLDVPYSEIISYDIFYGNPSSVTFYIQATDGSTQSPYLMDYNFKIAYIWDSEN